jgi:hypothetical protein
MRRLDVMKRIMSTCRVVVATVFVIDVIIYRVAVSASTFGVGDSIATPVVISTFLYLDSTIEDDNEKNS